MSIFKGLSGKLLIIAGIPVLGLLISSVIAIQGIGSLGGEITKLSSRRIPITQLLGDLRIHTNAVGRLMWQSISTHDRQELSQVRLKLDERLKQLSQVQEQLQTIGLVPDNLENLSKFNSLWTPLKKEYESILKDLTDSNEGDRNQLVLRLNNTIDTSNQITNILLAMGDVMSNTNLKSAEAAQNLAQNVRSFMIIISAIFSVLALGFTALFNTRLNKVFSMLSKDLSQAESNLCFASAEMSKASSSLSSSSVQGAASLEETVASLEEINSQVTLNSDRANTAQKLSLQVRDCSVAGEKQINQLLIAINEIDVSSKKIQDIIGIIDDISFQTNLLALNAAVEAARAGEHGRGFAVVAEAVRTLSQKSANSAREINQLILESSQKTELGVQSANASHTAMREVIVNIEKLTNLNSEIAAASQEQAVGLQQISTATSQLDTATQSNAAVAEEASATAEELNSQSREIHKIVDNFVVIVKGSHQSKAA